MNKPQRIQLIGGSGCGKSTAGLRISKQLGAHYCDLDYLHWDPQWTEVSDDTMRARLAPVIAQERWVLAGNYPRVWPTIWPRLDLLIWLDLSLHIKAWRTFKRSLRRAIYKEPCCNGNYESIGRLFTRDSVLLYLVQTHAQRRREYEAAMQDPQRPPFKFIRLRTQREVDALIDAL